MLVIDDFSRPAWPGEGSVITIGAYDGLHIGHRTVIDRVVERARAETRRSAVVTFDRHPASLVRPESAPKLLTDHHQKLDLLADTGIEAVAVVPFDSAQAAESAEDFVERVLVRVLGVRRIMVGSDFHFGRGRSGNVELLDRMGQRLGFDVEPIALVESAGVVSSSTAIRRALAEGDLDSAARMLGRRHEIRGTVVRGDQRGRTIGFPTANVEVPAEICLPADGVYAAWYVRENVDGLSQRFPAAVNIGRRPTFYEDAPVSLVEAHLLDVEGIDLYGERARLSFVRRLRGERKFAGLDELKAQLSVDVSEARIALRGG